LGVLELDAVSYIEVEKDGVVRKGKVV